MLITGEGEVTEFLRVDLLYNEVNMSNSYCYWGLPPFPRNGNDFKIFDRNRLVGPGVS